jgi:phosphatidylserine decarboxylase
VPVAAILVAGIRLNFLDLAPERRRHDAVALPCDAPFRKGDEMGWFEHGSTIIVLAPDGFAHCDTVREGITIRMGQPLMRLP